MREQLLRFDAHERARRLLRALRSLVDRDGFAIISGEHLRYMYSVGKHGALVSPAMERELRTRGYDVYPAFRVAKSRDLLVVSPNGAPASGSELGRLLVDLVRLEPANRYGVVRRSALDAPEDCALRMVCDRLNEFECRAVWSALG